MAYSAITIGIKNTASGAHKEANMILGLFVIVGGRFRLSGASSLRKTSQSIAW